MNANGIFIAALLDASSKGYAANAVLALMEADEAASQEVQAIGFSVLVEALKGRVAHLAEALACGRAEVFLRDLEWVVESALAPQLPAALIRRCLEQLSADLQAQLPPSAREMTADYLAQGVAYLKGERVLTGSPQRGDNPLAGLQATFQSALLRGQRAEAIDLMVVALKQGATLEELHAHVIGVTQVALGELWHKGQLNVAQEHFASRVVEDLLVRLRAELGGNTGHGKTVVLASVAGNHHDIGPRILADQLEALGWTPVFLGGDLPLVDMVEAVQAHAPRFVALSVALLVNLRSAAKTIEALKGAVPETPIMVGGGALRLIDGLWKDLGADVYANTIREATIWSQGLLSQV